MIQCSLIGNMIQCSLISNMIQCSLINKMMNPMDRSDLELYDIYFRERLIQDLYSGCMEEGLEAWPEIGIFL